MNIYIPEIINSYMNDFLFMPILLTVCLVGVRWVKRDNQVKLTLGMLLLSLIFVSVIFEIVMPSKSEIYRSDYLDILAYGLGTVIFYLLHRKKNVINRLL